MRLSYWIVHKTSHHALVRKFFFVGIGAILGLCFFYLFRILTISSDGKVTYIIGQETMLASLSLMGKEKNISAFNEELLTAIANEESFHVKIFPSPHPIEDLENGTIQGILTAIQTSYLYENQFNFSHPFFLTGPVLIIPSTEFSSLWNERRKKIVAIQPNSPLLRSLEQDPSMQIKFYDDILPALADLRAKKIDGAIFPAIPAYTYAEIFYKNEIKIATDPLTDEGLRLVTLKNKEGNELMEKFNEGLLKLKKNGTYNNIMKHWDLVNIEEIVRQHAAPQNK